MQQSGDRENARLTSLALPKAGAWLTALPLDHLGTHMSSQDFGLAAKLRLGLDIFPQGLECSVCQEAALRTPVDSITGHRPAAEILDTKGDVAMCCGKGGGWTRRHNVIRDAICELASQAKLSPTLEPPHLVDSTFQRPADVFLPSFPLGKSTCLDVGIVYPLQSGHLRHSAVVSQVTQ